MKEENYFASEIKSEDRFPNKKYKIIYADPPWNYRDKAKSGNRGAGCKYDIMTERSLCDLPVKDIADKDCVLFLWVTIYVFNVIRAEGTSRLRGRRNLLNKYLRQRVGQKRKYIVILLIVFFEIFAQSVLRQGKVN